MPRASNSGHAAIRIRAVHGWPRVHGEEAPHFSLTATEKAELGRIAQIIDFRTTGSEIFSQGEEAGFLYLLADGVVRTHHTLRNGERQVLAFYWPGDLFGLAEEGKYASSADTVAPSTVYRFPVRRLAKFLLRNPRIQNGFLVKAIHELRSAQRQLIVMGRFDVPRRLAAFLLDCSAHEKYFNAKQEILTLPMTRYDIADYLGTSAETVTRAMTRLEADGLVRRLSPRALKLQPGRLKVYIDLD